MVIVLSIICGLLAGIQVALIGILFQLIDIRITVSRVREKLPW